MENDLIAFSDQPIALSCYCGDKIKDDLHTNSVELLEETEEILLLFLAPLLFQFSYISAHLSHFPSSSTLDFLLACGYSMLPVVDLTA